MSITNTEIGSVHPGAAEVEPPATFASVTAGGSSEPHPAATGSVRGDTVAFVQEWLMNSDYDPTQFDRDFAAAIDARCALAAAPTPDAAASASTAVAAGQENMREAAAKVAESARKLAVSLGFAKPNSIAADRFGRIGMRLATDIRELALSDMTAPTPDAAAAAPECQCGCAGDPFICIESDGTDRAAPATPPASDAAITAGFVLVPIEPTGAMRYAAAAAETRSEIWSAMLAAARKVASDTGAGEPQ